MEGRIVAQGGLDFTPLALTALVPSVLRSELRALLAPLPPEFGSRALLLLDCLTIVDPPHA
jgi:hypothetical protein